MTDQNQTRQGVLLALGAFTMWGIAPVYFKAITEVPAPEILAHRVIWSFVFLAAIIWLTGNVSSLKTLVRSPKRLGLLAITSLFIGANWLVFIWAVNNNLMLDASLGYYINPLISIVLGMLFLGERFRRLQWFAVLLATTGVVVQLVTFGSLPWIALFLAGSFGTYGLLRKKIRADAATGLFIETAVLLPVALIYLFGIADSPTSDLSGNSTTLNLLLFSAGIVTTLPLLCFTGAATRLRLSTLGFFQYIGPSLMFILAVAFYGERFTADKATTFVFIWLALIIFTYDAWRNRPKHG
ncbi:EamA family transporter RarD [Parasalinivibrio latis]|uniref:EamA family transporter RarD n=1 Tax=Parasalinivibrio latis TaxID=2952610 RepID=UPI0030E0CA79